MYMGEVGERSFVPEVEKGSTGEFGSISKD